MCPPLTCSCWEAFMFWQNPPKPGRGRGQAGRRMATGHCALHGRARHGRKGDYRMWILQASHARQMAQRTCTWHGRFENTQRLEAALTLTPPPREECSQHPQRRDPGQSLHSPSQQFCPGPPGDFCSTASTESTRAWTTTVLQAVPTRDGTGDAVLRQFSLLKGKREHLSPTTCYTLETANTNEKMNRTKILPIMNLQSHQTPWIRYFCFTIYM